MIRRGVALTALPIWTTASMWKMAWIYLFGQVYIKSANDHWFDLLLSSTAAQGTRSLPLFGVEAWRLARSESMIGRRKLRHRTTAPPISYTPGTMCE